MVLIFENGLYPSSANTGTAIQTYYAAGNRGVVIGTFYDQGRSDNPTYMHVGYGLLETVHPFTAEAGGCEYNADSMNPASIVGHPIMKRRPPCSGAGAAADPARNQGTHGRRAARVTERILAPTWGKKDGGGK